MEKCPYCGRRLREHERYCDFCEQDLSEVIDHPVKYLLAKLKRKKKKETKPKPKLDVSKVTPPVAKKEETFKAYCVKCKKKVDGKNPKEYIMKNKRLALKGVCPVCSTKVFRIVGMKTKKSKK